MSTTNTNTPSNNPIKPKHGNGWKHDIDDVVRVVVPMVCSVLMLLWLFQKVDFHRMWQLITSGANYWWILLMMFITMFSHMIRGTRWGIQLRAVGVDPPLVTLWVSIFGAYSLNLLFTGVGEAWRCLFISRREHVRLSTVIGTDIGDRISDLAVILLLCTLMLCVANSYVLSFLHKYPVGREMLDLATKPWFWIVVVALFTAVWVAIKYFGDRGPMPAIIKFCKRMWTGFKVLFTMRGRGMYLVYTFGIWICYFMETYVCFMAFPFTRSFVFSPDLAYGFLPGLVCFVFCSISMVIPSNGGLGPWNLAMVFGLSLFGVDATEGAAFAMLMWSAQALMLIILGLFSAGYVAMTKTPGTKKSKAHR